MKVSKQTPFAAIEWLIAWRYLRARKSEGGVSAISLIALIGISLGVAAMIITFAVRSGFRTEYVKTILGNEGHAEVQAIEAINIDGALKFGLPNFDNLSAEISTIEGVQSATPLIASQALITINQRDSFTEVLGIKPKEFLNNGNLVDNGRSYGAASEFTEGEFVIALGAQLAWSLGAQIGDTIILTSSSGVDTAFGSAPRQAGYRVVYIVSSGNDLVDRARVYLPFDKAQEYFNMEGLASRIDVRVDDPEEIEIYRAPVESKLGGRALMRNWKDKNANVLNGLRTEDNIMYILMSVLVLVSSFTIAAGLIMLVKNKTSDIAILRTMGFSRGRVMRIFFLAGVSLSIIGTVIGVLLGALFCFYFDQIFLFVNWIIGGSDGVWALQVIDTLKAEWNWPSVLKTCALALGISIVITIFPARSAAKLDPAEALRHG